MHAMIITSRQIMNTFRSFSYSKTIKDWWRRPFQLNGLKKLSLVLLTLINIKYWVDCQIMIQLIDMR